MRLWRSPDLGRRKREGRQRWHSRRWGPGRRKGGDVGVGGGGWAAEPTSEGNGRGREERESWIFSTAFGR